MPLTTVRCGNQGRPALPWWRGSGRNGSRWADWASESSWRCMGSLLSESPQLRSWVYLQYASGIPIVQQSLEQVPGLRLGRVSPHRPLVGERVDGALALRAGQRLQDGRGEAEV